MERLLSHFGKILEALDCVYILETNSKKNMTIFYGNHSSFHVNMVHNIAPTQITLHRIHLSHDALCPICQEAEETIIHIIKCNDSNGILR
jgi:hypothetical protein